VIGLEELNALIAWSKTQEWKKPPVIPALDERLRKNLDTDVRIALCWDADNTDVDLHVVEPSGEEAFYSHNRTTIGGLVSRDFTQGYGPEEYLVRRAQPGTYKIFAHYFGSHQQTVTGAATVTATVFIDFGRPTEKKQVLTLRLDKPDAQVEVGRILIGGDKPGTQAGKEDNGAPLSASEMFRALRAGQSADSVKELAGEAQKIEGDVWIYKNGDREYRVKFTKEKKVRSVVEVMRGGAETILVQ